MHDINQFLDSPASLLDICHEVIVALDAKRNRPNIEAQKKQLREISRSIENLENNGVPVPDELRSLKIDLVAKITMKEEIVVETDSALEELAIGFEETLKDLCLRIDRKFDPIKLGSKRKKSEIFPKTNKCILRKKNLKGITMAQKDLRAYIIHALKKLGGRARVADVLQKMEHLLNGKLQPGDYELRQDGRTIVWHNNAQWERLRMVKAGILRSDSPFGIWELTEDCR